MSTSHATHYGQHNISLRERDEKKKRVERARKGSRKETKQKKLPAFLFK